jgi:hypothetical protein
MTVFIKPPTGCIASITRLHAPNGISRQIPDLLAGYLQKTFPEIARSTAIIPVDYDDVVEYENVEHKVEVLGVDSAYLEMSGVKTVEGSMDFLSDRSNSKMAVTPEKALQMFGNESPVSRKENKRKQKQSKKSRFVAHNLFLITGRFSQENSRSE